MKIAVAVENNVVAGHFGHCESFYVFETEDNQLVNGKSVANPGHDHGPLPFFLHDMGVTVVIAGGMGRGALNKCNEKGLEVITGAEGSVEAVVKSYLAGTLESKGAGCQGHNHHHEHGHKHEHHQHKKCCH